MAAPVPRAGIFAERDCPVCAERRWRGGDRHGGLVAVRAAVAVQQGAFSTNATSSPARIPLRGNVGVADPELWLLTATAIAATILLAQFWAGTARFADSAGGGVAV